MPKTPPRKTDGELKAEWTARFTPLIGRTITRIRYLSDAEVTERGWMSAPIVIELDDGTAFHPASDDEGNDAGALHFLAAAEGVPDIAPVI